MAKIIRIKSRVYRDGYRSDEETGERWDVKEMVSHAEYAVITGQTIHARLKRSNSQWVAIERGDETRFGMVVSPMNVRSWRELRKWALEKWGGGGKTEDKELTLTLFAAIEERQR